MKGSDGRIYRADVKGATMMDQQEVYDVCNLPQFTLRPHVLGTKNNKLLVIIHKIIKFEYSAKQTHFG